MRLVQFIRACAAASLCAAASACGNAGSTPPSVAILGQPSPSPTPFNGHLYVEYSATPGAPLADGVAVYALPLSARSAPLYTIAGPMGPIAFDPYGNLFACNLTSIVEYRYPFSAASTPATVIAQGATTIPTFVNDIGFDANGDLWAQTTYDLRDFVPPFTPGTAAQSVVTGGGLNQLIFSPSGKLFSGVMSLHFGSTDTVDVYAQFPYVVPPKKIVNAAFGPPMGFFPDGTVLVSSSGANVQDVIPGSINPPGLEVLPPSLSASTTAPYIIPFTVSNEASLAHPGAVDQNGTAYVLNGKANDAVDVFAFPVIQGASRETRLSCVQTADGCEQPLGVYLGP